MIKGFTLTAVLAAALAAVAACTHKEDAPPLAGPSGFANTVTDAPFATFKIVPNPVDLSSTSVVTYDASASCGVAPSSSTGVCPMPVGSFQFAFSDGTTASGPVVVRKISDDSIGTISAVLVVTNDRGAAASTSRSAQVLRSPPPKADFTFVAPPVLSAPGNVTVFFTDTSTVVAPRVIVNWQWDFLDGRPPSTGPSVPHTFSVDGSTSFTVVLTVTDDLGQKSTSAKPVSVTVTPPIKTTAVVH
ncbi:MAG TPA: PKD domain-containing protein [Vicinamibacterales bacterium]|nr:PKD domain-containing protein [Vicinamibacterales bacterium]